MKPHRGIARAPVFIAGCGCSGTTVLRLMLDAHPALCIPPESHFIYQTLRMLAYDSRDLKEGRLWMSLQNAITTSPWLEHWKLDLQVLRERLAEVPVGHLAEVYRACFELEAAQAGKPCWGDKTPQHVQYILVLAQLFPRARFIHVIRDGRGTAWSLWRRKWGPSTAVTAGAYWVWLVLSGLVAGRLLGPDRYRELRLEALLANPEAELRDLCNWLELPWDPALLDYHETESAQRFMSHGSPRKRAGTPLDRRYAERWQTELAARERGLIEWQAGPLLAALGYPVSLSARGKRGLQDIRQALETTRWPVDPGYPGPGGLRRIRAAQAANLATRRYAAWAQGSLAWQAGVCARLGLSPGGATFA